MHYDTTSKIIISHCKDAILRELCGISVRTSELLDDRPQETASIRRSDYVLRVTCDDGARILVLIEFQVCWKSWLPLRTLECRCRHILKEGLPVRSVIILFRPYKDVITCYRDEEVEYRYRVVKLYEINAQDILRKNICCLYPFIPIMKGGDAFIDEAEKEIYSSSQSMALKADLLTGMAIFGGLISPDIPRKLIQRRRDIMIQSAAYEIIKQEGRQEGITIGRQEGMVADAQEMVIDVLIERFGVISPLVMEQIRSITVRDVLKALHKYAVRAKDIDDFREKLKNAMS